MCIRKIVASVVAVTMVALAGCGGSASSNGQPSGAVHGTIVMTGGASGASPIGAAGTVIASRGGNEVRRQDVAEGQQFRFILPAGKYKLSVRAVSGACVEMTVTIAAGSDQTVSLVCQRK